MQTATTQKTQRFFAITPDRLKLARAARLTANDIFVWSYIEITAAPGRLKRISLSEIAEALHISIDTVSRALRKLLSVGVITRQDCGGRLYLCPASLRSDSQPKQVITPNVATSKEKLKQQREKLLDKEGTELVTTLEARYGIWKAKGEKLVLAFGANQVKEVVAWAEYKGTELNNPGGWVQACLEKGWAAPEGFYQKRQGGQEGPSLNRAAVVARVLRIRSDLPAYSIEEKTKALMQAALVGEEKAARQLAEEWGVSLPPVTQI